jgi:hypothetical protein
MELRLPDTDALGLSVFSRIFIGPPVVFLSRNGDIKSPVHMVIHDVITNDAYSTIEDHVCSNHNAENRYPMGTELQITSFLTKTPFASNLHHR